MGLPLTSGTCFVPARGYSDSGPAAGRVPGIGIATVNSLLTWQNATVRPKIARVYDYRPPAVETLTM